MIRLRRELAALANIRVRDFPHEARISYGKVGEFQRRGAVHFHAVIRIDGPDGPHTRPPAWATDELLEQSVRAAVASSKVTTEHPDGSPLALKWGRQLDIRRITSTARASVEDTDGAISEARLAAYVAKYSTKDTGATTGGVDRPVRSQRHLDYLRVTPHHRRLIQTAWTLGGLERYAPLNLRKWAHMLGFRGHFLTKSRAYSMTFTAIRLARRTYRLEENLTRLGFSGGVESVAVINDWRFVGAGYRDDAEIALAAGIAARLRSRENPVREGRSNV